MIVVSDNTFIHVKDGTDYIQSFIRSASIPFINNGGLAIQTNIPFLNMQQIDIPFSDGVTTYTTVQDGYAYLVSICGEGNPIGYPTDPSAIFQLDSTTKGFLEPRMTESEMNLIVTPAVGLSIFNLTRSTKMYYHDYFGWTPLSIVENSWWGYSFFDESTSSNGIPWAIAFANGGTAVNSTLPALSPTSLYGFATGVTSNGDSQSRTGTYFRASSGKKRTESRVVVSILSTALERYVCFFGYLGSTNLLDQANAMYFLYDEGGLTAGSVASPNWQCVCASGSIRTFVTTSVPVAAQAGNLMQKLRIDDDGTGTNVKFYIDDVIVATITTDVPTGTTVNMSNLVRITKTVGTTQRSLYVDYISMKEKFNTPR